MPEQSPAEQPLVNPDVRYENTDARVGPIAAIGVGLLVLGLVVHAVAAWTFDALKARADRKDPGVSPLAARERPRLPEDLKKIPEPRLQVSETADMDQLRRTEDARLKGYGWTNAQKGTVHIPIAEAMRLLADPKSPQAKRIRVEPARDKPAPKGGKG